MPRRRKTIVEDILPDVENVELDKADFEVDEEDGSVQEWLTAYGPNEFTIKVYRMTDKGSEYCYSSEEMVHEDDIQARYGGGNYVLRLYIENKFKKSKRVKIAQPILATPVGVDSNANMAIQMAQMQLAMMKESNERTMQILLQVLGRPSTATPVAELTEVFKLANPGGSPQTGGPLTMMREMIELIKEMGGNSGTGDWKSGIVDGIKEIAKPVAMVLAQQAMGGHMATQPSQNPALPAGSVDVTSLIREAIAFIKPKITMGFPWEVAADWVTSNANDPKYQPFIQLALNGTFEHLVAIDNSLAEEPYNSWCRKLLQGIKDFYAGNDSNDTDGERGNDGDVAIDARANLKAVSK